VNVTGGKKWTSRRFLEEFPSKGWSSTKSSFDRLVTKIDNGLPTDNGRGCRRLVRSTVNVARVEELICSHGVAPSSVIRFH